MKELSKNLGELLQKKDLKLAVAESCTGGLLSSVITAIPGSSSCFDRGFITYSNEAKHELLNVSLHTLQQYGAVSSETAKAMVQGVLVHSHADIAVSTTGIAGPDGSEDKPVGLVFFGLADKKGFCNTYCRHFSGDRESICQQAVEFILQCLVDYLSN